MTVLKLGGSLLDLGDLGVRLHGWLGRLGAGRVLIVPGGGEAAENVRRLQAIHRFPDEQAHHWAMSAMDFNAELVESILVGGKTVENWAELQEAWKARQLPILKVWFFLAQLEAEEQVEYPRNWSFTSDSIAASIAAGYGAERLILLKSRAAKPGLTWQQHAADGLVDAFFPRLAPRIPRIDVVDFRANPLNVPE